MKQLLVAFQPVEGCISTVQTVTFFFFFLNLPQWALFLVLHTA